MAEREKPVLTAAERGILKEAVARLEAARRDLVKARDQVAQQEAAVEQRQGGFEASLNTIVRLKGLDPNLTQLRYDVMSDVWELQVLELPAPLLPFAPTAQANGHAPEPGAAPAPAAADEEDQLPV